MTWVGTWLVVGDLQSRCIRLGRDHDADLRVQFTTVDGGKDGFEVAAPPGYQYTY